ncbi:unnamed protein product, partial [Durusdinium trenchii]
ATPSLSWWWTPVAPNRWPIALWRVVMWPSSCSEEFLVLLDPAVRLDAPLAPLPGEVAAAGRLWTRPALVEEDYIESLGRRQHPTFRAAGSLLAADVVRGGLLRTEAVLDALADEQVMKIDWNRLAAEDASLFADPVALHYALAAR